MRRTRAMNGHAVKDLDKFLDRIHVGDCLKIMPRIPAGSIDLVLCDLPYGTTQNEWDCPISLDELWREYSRVRKPSGVVALTAQGAFTARLIMSNLSWFKYKIVWEKSKPTNFLNARKQPLRKHEDICIFYGQRPVYHPQMQAGGAYDKGVRKSQFTGSYGCFAPVRVKSDGGRFPCDIIYFKTSESEGEVYHPTQKPIALGRYLIRTFTNPGGVVLDNTCGSGSFLVSAVLEERRFVGIEMNRDVLLHKRHSVNLVEIARKRIREAQREAAAFLPAFRSYTMTYRRNGCARITRESE